MRLALYHSRSGFYESCYVFRSGGDDCPYSRQPLCGSFAFGFLAVCYGDPLAWIAADLFLVPAFYLCLQEVEKEAGAYKRFGYASGGIGLPACATGRGLVLYRI